MAARELVYDGRICAICCVHTDRNQETCSEKCRSRLRRKRFREHWSRHDPQLAAGSKRCNLCKEHKARSDFFRAVTSHDGLQGYCKACKPKYQREHLARRRYGIEDWEGFVATREGACEICGRLDQELHIDHDHACCPSKVTCGGCVRGLLCGSCNRALGLLGDDVERLKAAIAYLGGAK